MRTHLIPFVVAATLIGAGVAQAASFDCNRARALDEKVICADRSLNDKDVRMALLFDISKHLVGMGARGAMQDQQVDWLRDRRRCAADRPCLNRSYDRRIADLNRSMERVYSAGPF